MALLCDEYGFIIGEKRLKQLNGNVAQIGDTTKDILSILTNTYAKQKTYVRKKDKLFSELIDICKLTSKQIAKKPITDVLQVNTNQDKTDDETSVNNQIKTIRLKQVKTKRDKDPSKSTKLTAKSVSVENQNHVQQNNNNYFIKVLQSATDVINVLGADSQNISPEIDALHEIKDIVSPAGRAFKMMGQGVGYLFKKQPNEASLPKEQIQQHKQTNKHNKEIRRLYRLILQKLIGSSIKILALKSMIGGLPVLGNKTNNDHTKDADKNKKHSPRNKKGGKLAVLWSGAMAALGGLMTFLENISSENEDQTNDLPKRKQDDTRHHKSVKNHSSVSGLSKNLLGGGTVAMLAAITAAMINPASIPLALVAGGVTGLGLTAVIGEKIEPYLVRMNDGVHHIWQSVMIFASAGVDTSISAVKNTYNVSRQAVTTVWEFANAVTVQSVKGLNAIFVTGKQGLLSVVEYAVQGVMAVLPSFGLAIGLSNVAQSLGDFGLRVGQNLYNIGQRVSNIGMGAANSDGAGVADNMVSTAEATKMAEYAASHAAQASLGKCALYVNNAVRSLGYKAWGHGLDSARNIINSNKDFVEVAYGANYVPQDGDIMSINHGRHDKGHVAIYNAKLGKWVSDFVQHKTRGNTAATNDGDYQNILSGKAKVTIARHKGKNKPVPQITPKKTQNTKTDNTKSESDTSIKTTNAFQNLNSGFVANNTSVSLSSNVATNTIQKSQTLTSEDYQVYSTLINQESHSAWQFFKTLIGLSKKSVVTPNNLELWDNHQLMTSSLVMPIYAAKQSISNPTVVHQAPIAPKKADLPAFGLKIPLFGKFARSKNTQVAIKVQKPTSRLPVHTVVGQDSFV